MFRFFIRSSQRASAARTRRQPGGVKSPPHRACPEDAERQNRVSRAAPPRACPCVTRLRYNPAARRRRLVPAHFHGATDGTTTAAGIASRAYSSTVRAEDS